MNMLKFARTILDIFPLSKLIKDTQQSRLESYLYGKNVQTTAEVEYWTREFENKEKQSYFETC
jgi:hypothetical protein